MAATLLHRREFGDAFGDAQNLVFSDDQIVLAIQFDLCAGVLSNEHVLPSLHVQGHSLAVVVYATAADRHDFGLLRFLFGSIGDDDATDTLFLFLDTLDENAITKRSDIHEDSPIFLISLALTLISLV